MENKSKWGVLGLSAVLAVVGVVSLVMAGSDSYNGIGPDKPLRACAAKLSSPNGSSCFLPANCTNKLGVARIVEVPDTATAGLAGVEGILCLKESEVPGK